MENYLEYLNESPTIFFKCTPQQKWPVEFVTKNVEPLFGYTSNDFTTNKLDFIDCVYEEDRATLKEEIEEAIKNNQDECECTPYRIITKNKALHWVQDLTKITRDDNGNILYFYCYIINISKEKAILEKLNLTEDIISTIYNNTFQFIGLMETDGTLIKANKTSLEFINLKEEDIIGKKFWDCPWWAHSKEEQLQLQKDINEAVQGKSVHSKKIHYDNNGNKIYVDFSIKPVFNNKNRVIYLIPEGHNITNSVLRQRELENYLKIINEHVLISTTDLEGKITGCSHRFVKTFEYSEEELMGSRHNIMKHKSTEEKVYKHLWETITQKKV